MVHVDGHEDSREFEDALFPRSGATSLNSSFSSSLLAREREAFSFGSDLKASELAQSLGSEDTTLRLSTLPVVPQGEELRTWEEALSSAHANTPSEEETPQIIPTTISPSLLHVSFDNQSALPIPIPAVTAETAQAADEARVMPPPSSSHTRRKATVHSLRCRVPACKRERSFTKKQDLNRHVKEQHLHIMYQCNNCNNYRQRRIERLLPHVITCWGLPTLTKTQLRTDQSLYSMITPGRTVNRYYGSLDQWSFL